MVRQSQQVMAALTASTLPGQRGAAAGAARDHANTQSGALGQEDGL